jgi:hypothetical protein
MGVDMLDVPMPQYPTLNETKESNMPVSKQEAIELFHESMREANKVFGLCLYTAGWSIDFNRRKRSIGLCRYDTKTIEISEHYLAVNTVDQVKETITHEIAHAIAGYSAGHGPKWKATHRALGGNANRVATGDDSNRIEAAYKVVNSLTGDTVAEYFRKPRRDISRCWLQGQPETLGKLVIVKC